MVMIDFFASVFRIIGELLDVVCIIEYFRLYVELVFYLLQCI